MALYCPLTRCANEAMNERYVSLLCILQDAEIVNGDRDWDWDELAGAGQDPSLLRPLDNTFGQRNLLTARCYRYR